MNKEKSLLTYWVSFASISGHLGCCIVDADSQIEARDLTKTLGICPEGTEEIVAFDISGNDEEVNKWGKNRLISPEDINNENYVKIKPELTNKIIEKQV